MEVIVRFLPGDLAALTPGAQGTCCTPRCAMPTRHRAAARRATFTACRSPISCRRCRCSTASSITALSGLAARARPRPRRRTGCCAAAPRRSSGPQRASSPTSPIPTRTGWCCSAARAAVGIEHGARPDRAVATGAYIRLPMTDAASALPHAADRAGPAAAIGPGARNGAANHSGPPPADPSCAADRALIYRQVVVALHEAGEDVVGSPITCRSSLRFRMVSQTMRSCISATVADAAMDAEAEREVVTRSCGR